MGLKEKVGLRVCVCGDLAEQKKLFYSRLWVSHGASDTGGTLPKNWAIHTEWTNPGDHPE